MPMTIPTGILCVAAAWLLAAPFAHAQKQPSSPAPASTLPATAAAPDFQIEIQPSAEKGPTFTVRNMSDKAITACVFEFSYTGAHRRLGGMVWDAAMQHKPVLEPGATLTNFLSHATGEPLPDKVEVVAGAFADGETFGQPKWIKILLQDRAVRLGEYEQAAAFLRKGLDEHWTYEQYLAALEQAPKLDAAQDIRRSLEVNTSLQRYPENLQEFVESMVDRYNRYARKIRDAQAPANPPASQPPSQ
jgi:hypothetical protein